MIEPLEVSVERLPHAADLPLPEAASEEAAGVDLIAAIDEDIVLSAGERRLVPSGIRLVLPSGFEAQIRPRSGLALKHGITVLNAPGTVDADYRGEVGVILVNLGEEAFTVSRGMRIAQLVVAAVRRLVWRETQIGTGDSRRAEGGFGSTGMTAIPSDERTRDHERAG